MPLFLIAPSQIAKVRYRNDRNIAYRRNWMFVKSYMVHLCDMKTSDRLYHKSANPYIFIYGDTIVAIR